MSFTTFNLNQNLIKAISDMGYVTPTDIQAESIPLLLEHDGDFVGQAQTGTGKTAAFGLPLLENIDYNSSEIQGLILAPTRELAQQVAVELIKFGHYTPLRVVQVYGGVSYTAQIKGLKNDRPHVVVGTPGRIIDLIDKGILKLGHTKQLVIDEADEMLNMGFLEDVQKIIDELNPSRKVWMFSATMPKQIQNLIAQKFNAPEFLKVKKKTLSNENISQHYCILKKNHFTEGLKRLVEIEEVYGIVFLETKREAQQLCDELTEKGIPVVAIHGDMGQAQREFSMKKFKEKKVNLLVCTDVAARGIDVSSVTHVINFGFPRNHESYVHRIGRTGRAGLKGTSITFLSPDQKFQIRKMEDLTKTKVEPYKVPTPTELKKIKVSKELEKMDTLRQAIVEKGESFKIDESFDTFKNYFDDMDQEKILKLLFSWKFNKELRHIDDLGDISSSFQSRSSSRPSFSHDRPRGRSDDRRRSDGRRDHGGNRSGRSERNDRNDRSDRGDRGGRNDGGSRNRRSNYRSDNRSRH